MPYTSSSKVRLSNLIVRYYIDKIERFEYNILEEGTLIQERSIAMIITATEFKTNLGKYLELASVQDIFITKNGKNIARLTSPKASKLELLDGLVGVIAETTVDENMAREERLSRQ